MISIFLAIIFVLWWNDVGANPTVSWIRDVATRWLRCVRLDRDTAACLSRTLQWLPHPSWPLEPTHPLCAAMCRCRRWAT